MKKEIFRLANILFGGQKNETPVAAGVSTNVQEDLPMSRNVSNRSDQHQDTITFPFVPAGHAKARAQRWLDARLKRAQHEVFAEFGDLTPELAALLLDRNPPEENRILRASSTAARYARDITEGRWENNGESVVISADGLLNDGQHRCVAVLMAGKQIPVLFAFGVSRESRLTTDQGISKTAGDYLGMQGIQNSNHLAATAGMLIEIERHGKLISQAAAKPNKSEIRERVLQDSDIEASFKFVRRKGAKRIASFTTLATAHYLFSQADADDADVFMDRLIEGTELKARDPVFVVREKLISREVRLNKNEQLKALIMAWNNFRAGKTVRTLTHRVQRGEKLPGVK